MEESFRNAFGEVEVREGGRVLRMKVGPVQVEFRPDWFKDEGFESFSVFESEKLVEIPVLYKFLDYMWKNVYEECLQDGFGEVLVKTEDTGLKFVIRTVVYCEESNYLDCVKDLISLHLQVHEEAYKKMDKHKSSPV